MSVKVTKENIDLLLGYNQKLTRDQISQILGLPEGHARVYKGIVDNYSVITKESLKEGEINVKLEEIKTYVVSGCWHIPFHNQVLYSGFKQLIRDIDPDGFVIDGDFIDVGALSDYDRGRVSKTGVTLEDEYNAANVVLDELDSILRPDVEKYYLWGNHSERYYRWKSDVNNSKYGDILNPNRGMKLEERGYVIKDDYKNDFIELGSLQVLHGIYFNVHSAKQHLDKLRRNCMFVHTHRSQMFRTGDFAAWNIGFMGQIDAPCFNYADRGTKESWANGFALVHVTNDNFFVEQIDVVNSHFVYGGRKY